MATPFDILKHINSKDAFEFDMKDYNVFMINRGFSNTLDTLFFAEIINRYSHLDKDIQYRFYLDAIPKGKRFGKWNKSLAIDDDIILLMNKYEINQRVAESYYKLLSQESIVVLRDSMKLGGRK